MIDNFYFVCYYNKAFIGISGEVSEWFKEPVLKTGDPVRDRGFESHLLRQLVRSEDTFSETDFYTFCHTSQTEKYSSW